MYACNRLITSPLVSVIVSVSLICAIWTKPIVACLLQFSFIVGLFERLQAIKNGIAFPVVLHQLRAVGALTLHTGVRYRYMSRKGIKIPLTDLQAVHHRP